MDQNQPSIKRAKNVQKNHSKFKINQAFSSSRRASRPLNASNTSSTTLSFQRKLKAAVCPDGYHNDLHRTNNKHRPAWQWPQRRKCDNIEDLSPQNGYLVQRNILLIQIV